MRQGREGDRLLEFETHGKLLGERTGIAVRRVELGQGRGRLRRIDIEIRDLGQRVDEGFHLAVVNLLGLCVGVIEPVDHQDVDRVGRLLHAALTLPAAVKAKIRRTAAAPSPAPGRIGRRSQRRIVGWRQLRDPDALGNPLDQLRQDLRPRIALHAHGRSGIHRGLQGVLLGGQFGDARRAGLQRIGFGGEIGGVGLDDLDLLPVPEGHRDKDQDPGRQGGEEVGLLALLVGPARPATAPPG